MHPRIIIIALSAASVLVAATALTTCHARAKSYGPFTFVRSFEIGDEFVSSWAATKVGDAVAMPDTEGFLVVPLNSRRDVKRVYVSEEGMRLVSKENAKWGAKSIVKVDDGFAVAFALEYVPNPALIVDSQGGVISATAYQDSTYGVLAITRLDDGLLVLWARPSKERYYEVIGTKLAKDGVLSEPLFSCQLAKGPSVYAPYEVEVFWADDGRTLFVANKSVHGVLFGGMAEENTQPVGHPRNLYPAEFQVVVIEKATWLVEDRRILLLDTRGHPDYPEQVDSCLLSDNLMIVTYGLGAYLVSLDIYDWRRVVRLPYFKEQEPCFPLCVEREGDKVYWIDEGEIWALPVDDAVSYWSSDKG